MTRITGYLVLVEIPEIVAYEFVNERMVAIIADKSAERGEKTAGCRFIINCIKDVFIG